MASNRSKNSFAYGAPPRANFLPPKVKPKLSLEKRSENTLSRYVIYMFALCFSIYLWMSVTAFTGSQAITDSRIRIIEIKSEKASFTEVRELDSELSRSKKAYGIANYPNVMWRPIADQLFASLPAGGNFVQLDIRSLASGENLGTDSGLVKSATAIASLEMQVNMPTLDAIELWLNNLKKVSGYSSAKLKSVSLANAKYVAQVTMDLDQSVMVGVISPSALPTQTPAATTSPSPSPSSSSSVSTPTPTPTKSGGN